jgi:hypothetical protein
MSALKTFCGWVFTGFIQPVLLTATLIFFTMVGATFSEPILTFTKTVSPVMYEQVERMRPASVDPPNKNIIPASMVVVDSARSPPPRWI